MSTLCELASAMCTNNLKYCLKLHDSEDKAEMSQLLARLLLHMHVTSCMLHQLNHFIQVSQH